MGEQKSMPSYFVHVSSVPVQGRVFIARQSSEVTATTAPAATVTTLSLPFHMSIEITGHFLPYIPCFYFAPLILHR